MFCLVAILFIGSLTLRFFQDELMDSRNRLFQLILIDWLCEVEIDTVTHGGLSKFEIRNTAQNNKLSGIAGLHSCLYNFNPCHFRHPDIQKDKIRIQTFDLFKSVLSVACCLTDGKAEPVPVNNVF